MAKVLIDIRDIERIENDLIHIIDNLETYNINELKDTLNDTLERYKKTIKQDNTKQKNEFKKFIYDMMKGEKDKEKNNKLYVFYKQIDSLQLNENETYFDYYFKEFL